MRPDRSSRKKWKPAAKLASSTSKCPVAFDALTVVVNPQNTWAKTLTPAELKKMWEPAAQGRITKWNQVRADFPAEPLMMFGPGADSGTFDYFTEAVNGRAKSSRTDFQASEDDNVIVQGVSSTKVRSAISAMPTTSATRSAIRAVPISEQEGQSSRTEPGSGDRRQLRATVAPFVHLRA